MGTKSDQSTVLSSPCWDVFLSFRGEDTRNTITAHLYHALTQAGIQTFRDDPQLEKGEEISSELIKAIRDSKISVIVFSKNYASSSWCLDELVEILDCRRTMGQVVLPVFYHVDPSDVRHQNGSFEEAFKKHNQRLEIDRVHKWKDALTEVSGLSGYDLKFANGCELDLVQKVVADILPKVYTKALHPDEHLVGIDSHVQDIYTKLKIGSNDVHSIGICGMGGIGKTTIAKAFYNRYMHQFEASCFLDNITKTLQGSGGLLCLVEQLLVQLLKTKDYKLFNVKRGLSLLENILCRKNILIILDDLDGSSDLKQLARNCNLSGTGSRIIITTRDAHLLQELQVVPYMVKNLREEESLELFSYHAFKRTTPLNDFKELSEKIVNYTGGLPLALKVLGSFLIGREVLAWESTLEKLKKVPNIEIQNILKLSYDALNDEKIKAIFLDIAIFFIGMDKDEAIDIFKSCGFFPYIGMEILEERCLLTVDLENKLRMHNLIQDMGKEVAREESILGKSSRLWCQGNEFYGLQTHKGADKIEGLILDLTTSTQQSINAKTFERLPNLRLLQIINAHDLKGTFDNSFGELRWIQWHHCSWTRLPSSFHPQNLVSLNMRYSKLTTLWKGTMPLVNLKTIDASYSKFLTTTPNFKGVKLLQKLLLRGCSKLLKFHPSIGELANLVHLNLSDCTDLKRLPDDLGNMEGLKILDASWTAIDQLPNSITHLRNLVSLYLGYCTNLRKLPEQMGNIKGLEMFDASSTAVEQLPDSITNLSNLIELRLSDCKNLRKLPEQLGNMKGLKTFDARYSAIEQLPHSIGHLSNLIQLRLRECKNLGNLPNSICNLSFLEVLEVDSCSNIDQLPEQLGKMQFLEWISASNTAIEELPDSIGDLSRLKTLFLDGSKKLRNFPDRILSLTSLRDLDLYQCLGNYPDSIKFLKNLDTLHLWTSNVRLCLPIILSLSSLTELRLTEVPIPDESWSLSSTKSLKSGETRNCSPHISLHNLFNLQTIELFDCISLGPSFPELPLNLKGIWFTNCTSLEHLPDLVSLRQLTHLYLAKCTSLESIPVLPPHVSFFKVCYCPALRYLPDLSGLKDLQDLDLTSCSNLKFILKEIFLQERAYSGFESFLQNREIPDWFSYQRIGCSVSFKMPKVLGNNFLGMVLWVVPIKNTTDPCIGAVIANKTLGTKRNVRSRVPYDRDTPSQVSDFSWIRYVSREVMSVTGGDRIVVSFGDGADVKMERCGVHLIYKPYS